MKKTITIVDTKVGVDICEREIHCIGVLFGHFDEESKLSTMLLWYIGRWCGR